MPASHTLSRSALSHKLRASWVPTGVSREESRRLGPSPPFLPSPPLLSRCPSKVSSLCDVPRLGYLATSPCKLAWVAARRPGFDPHSLTYPAGNLGKSLAAPASVSSSVKWGQDTGCCEDRECEWSPRTPARHAQTRKGAVLGGRRGRGPLPPATVSGRPVHSQPGGRELWPL